jgi:large conductance mechanosensitive channel
MLKGFKEFIMRGNVVDLAVAFVIGVAFAAVIKGFTDGIINPLIAAIFGQPNLDKVGTFTINNAHFSIGLILTPLINFLFVAAAIYFVLVLPMNTLRERQERKAGGPPAAEESELDVLRQIRDRLAQQQNG